MPAMKSDSKWVATWAVTSSPATPHPFASPHLKGFWRQTIRQVVSLSLGGKALRLRLSNLHGEKDVTFNTISVGMRQAESSIIEGTLRNVFFNGSESVTIPQGNWILSDPIDLETAAGSEITVNYYTSRETGAPTGGGFASSGAQAYVADGDRTGSYSSAGFVEAHGVPEIGRGSAWFLVGVDVLQDEPVAGAVVTIGDSITAGGKESWPSLLFERLSRELPESELSVLNLGVGGNRILSGSTVFNASAVDRFDVDVLIQSGARTVIMLEGVNDLGLPQATADDPLHAAYQPQNDPTAADLINGVRFLASKARDAGVRFLIGTILPFKGAWFWTPEAELKRKTFNDWARKTSEVDGYVDFAAILADAKDEEVLSGEFISDGDVLHPNATGKKAMADAIDLALL